MHYPDVLTAFPQPTAEQTERFAEHVSLAHSWYKSLPVFPPGASFVLFANPHAGCAVAKVGDRFDPRPLAKGDDFHHPSGLATADYLAQFGHWDYWVDDNPRVAKPEPGPWIYGQEDGGRALLPESVRAAWSCRLTAFLSPSPVLFGVEEMAADRDRFDLWSRTHAGDADAGRYRAFAEDTRRRGVSESETLEMLLFLRDEAVVQQARLRDALLRLRETWRAAHPAR